VIAASKPSSAIALEQVYWHPRVLWVGIGCERGTAQSLIAEAVQQTMLQHDLAMEAIAGVATLDLKEDEPGLLEFCKINNLPLTCFSAAELQKITVPNPSPVVDAAVGTPSVAEAAALAAAQQVGIELLPQPPVLQVPKQVFRKVGEPGAVTVAIAQAELEWTGRTGQLYLIGSGPGALEQMTPAALVAATQADIVIGYSLYLELLQSRFRPGQIIEPSPITQERQRAQRAIALAKWGLTVAVVSSGDAGIYGMAGLVLEELQAQGWDGKTPAVQIFPGVSALQAAASRVGTPLMHDFCAISLSDHLTPWEVIEKRLEAAAQADFVTAFYNPRSQVRVEQILKAQQIFLKYRNPHTPVALVRAAYRPDEEIQLTTLEKLNDAAIDMLTTVLIGNATTRVFQDWMITPRGYLGFESHSQ
jgi:cobalt-precorrin 5A hydrolase/precorrin-3B C17-methyltransferase